METTDGKSSVAIPESYPLLVKDRAAPPSNPQAYTAVRRTAVDSITPVLLIQPEQKMSRADPG